MSEVSGTSTTTVTSSTTLKGLVDTLDRLIDGGLLIDGEVIIGLAGVDLLRLDLKAMLAGVWDEKEAS